MVTVFNIRIPTAICPKSTTFTSASICGSMHEVLTVRNRGGSWGRRVGEWPWLSERGLPSGGRVEGSWNATCFDSEGESAAPEGQGGLEGCEGGLEGE